MGCLFHRLTTYQMRRSEIADRRPGDLQDSKVSYNVIRLVRFSPALFRLACCNFLTMAGWTARPNGATMPHPVSTYLISSRQKNMHSIMKLLSSATFCFLLVAVSFAQITFPIGRGNNQHSAGNINETNDSQVTIPNS
jgi:hypothetical protein